MEIERLADAIAGKPAPTISARALRQRLGGCEGVIASRLTPTVGSRTSERNTSAVRPSSRAGSLLQLDRVRLKETRRQSGRLREQAHSHRKAKQHPLRFSPLYRMSVSSAAAFDLLAPSAGFVAGLIRGGGARSAVRRSRIHRKEVQRSKPEAMPPDQFRSEGTPSPSERAERRGPDLWFLWGVCQRDSL
ncbi:hypothetical protein PS898_04667 [Pseudomonas fluorescens]|nr:hypothetical protein PS898_04667 [Pseudomonas fluorescens]